MRLRHVVYVQGLCISFADQIDHQFSKVNASLVQQLGQAQASTHLRKSIFVVAIGGNDILNNVLPIPRLVSQVISPRPHCQSPDEFIASLALSLKDQLQVWKLVGSSLLTLRKLAPLICTYFLLH